MSLCVVCVCDDDDDLFLVLFHSPVCHHNVCSVIISSAHNLTPVERDD